MNNVSYKLLIKTDNLYLIFDLNEENNISLFHYTNKYKFEDLIKILKINIDLYNNLEEIVDLITNVYTKNKISFNYDNKSINLAIKLLKGSKEYISIIYLNKKEYDINKKFELLFKEINILKKDKNIYIDEKLNQFEKLLFDIKNNINEKMNENTNIIKKLETKLKSNLDLLKENNNIIESLKDEITKEKTKLEKTKNEIIKKTDSVNKNLKKKVKEYEKQINQYNSLDTRPDYYSYLCVNKNDLNIDIFKGEKIPKIEIILKNNGILTWPKGGTILKNEYYSDFKLDNIQLDPQKPDEEKKYELYIKELENNNNYVGEKKIYLNFCINNDNYGDLIKIKLIFKNEEDPINKFRDLYSLSKEDYSNEKLLNALKSHNFDYEKSFDSLFE